MNNVNQTNYLDSLLDNFIDQPKFAGMSEAEKNEFKGALIQNYNDRITSLVILNMPQEVSNEFTGIAEKGNDEEIQAFIYKHIPNFDILVQNESTAFLRALVATNELPQN